MKEVNEAQPGTGGPFLLAIDSCPLFPEYSKELPKSPKQLVLYPISLKTARELNRAWHSRLPEITNASRSHRLLCLGLMFNNKWYASAIWTDPIARAFNGTGTLELRRMAICDEAPKNTASRMIAEMIKIIKMKYPSTIRLISYQDTDVHLGTIYKASNWVIGRITKKKEIRWGKDGRERNAIIATGEKIRWEKKI
jgi:hypothetical protein